MRYSWGFIILIFVAYLAGAKFPGFAQKIGVA